MNEALRSEGIDDLKEERSGASATDESVIGLAVKIADPDGEDEVIEDGDGPGVAEAHGGASFPEDALVAGGFAGDGSWDLAEHFEGEESGFWTEDAGTGSGGCGESFAEGAEAAAVGEGGVAAEEIFHGDLAATEGEGEPIEAWGVGEGDACVGEEVVEGGAGELFGEGDGGKIAATGEGIGGGDGASELAVIIFGGIAAEMAWGIDDHGFGVDEALIDSEGVDEGFEGGAWGAGGAGAVDLAGDGLVEEVRGAGVGEDFHGMGIDEHGGGVGDSEVSIGVDVGGDFAIDDLL